MVTESNKKQEDVLTDGAHEATRERSAADRAAKATLLLKHIGKKLDALFRHANAKGFAPDDLAGVLVASAKTALETGYFYEEDKPLMDLLWPVIQCACDAALDAGLSRDQVAWITLSVVNHVLFCDFSESCTVDSGEMK